MLKARVIVVEDEAIVCRDIAVMLEKHGHAVIAQCSSAEEAIAACERERPDIVIMDILLKGARSGIDAAIEIRAQWDVPVVFLTANTDPATVRMARTALPYGYIHKPFKTVDALTAIELALHSHAHDRRLRKERDELRASAGTDRSSAGQLFVNIKGRLQGIRLTEIHYVEALKDYVGIHLGDRRIVVHCTLTEMERNLPTTDFLRVHRSFIVRMERIKEIEGMDIIMEKNDQKIPIGGHHLANLRSRLGLDI